MPKTLPYWKWFPSDAEGDDFYASLTDAEGWTYHRLLNRSWINDGIPADLDDLARILGKSRLYVDKVWPKLSRRWVTSPRDPSKLVNPRQEEEFQDALKKSNNNKRPGNANASRSRLKREPIGTRHAHMLSVSEFSEVNSSEVELKKSSVREFLRKQEPESSSRFEEWWAAWSVARGTNHRIQAEAFYVRLVTIENEEDCFECTKSYLEHLEGSPRGYNPENFLADQASGGFKARWKARDSPTGASKSRQQLAVEQIDRL